MEKETGKETEPETEIKTEMEMERSLGVSARCRVDKSLLHEDGRSVAAYDLQGREGWEWPVCAGGGGTEQSQTTTQ